MQDLVTQSIGRVRCSRSNAEDDGWDSETSAVTFHIGATICRVVRIHNRELHRIGLDAIDGTPVLDLKPWFAEFGPRGEIKQPDWSRQIRREYWAK